MNVLDKNDRFSEELLKKNDVILLNERFFSERKKKIVFLTERSIFSSEPLNNRGFENLFREQTFLLNEQSHWRPI